MNKIWMVAVVAITMVPAIAQQTGGLKLKVDPGRAGVFVDGKYLGPAANFKMARTYQVAAGEHEVILREPRYEEIKTKVTVTAGKTTTVKETMKAKEPAKPPFGTLRLSGFEKFAPVYINGQFMGHADEFDFGSQGLLLNPGDYDLKVTTPAGATLLEKKVTIKESQIETAKKS